MKGHHGILGRSDAYPVRRDGSVRSLVSGQCPARDGMVSGRRSARARCS